MDRGIITLCNYVKRKYVIGGHYVLHIYPEKNSGQAVLS